MPNNDPKPKIIITGTGRAGTTFLVRLLTELGFDTGFTRENWQRHVHTHCSAGMEWDLADPEAPRVVKNPDLCERLGPLLATGRVRIERALVPVRDLDSAAASRVRIGVGVPGGLVGTEAPDRQRAVLADRFHQLIEALAAHSVPVTFLHFPRFATDAEYCYAQLAGALGGIDWLEFEAAHARLSDPALIHDFRRADALRDAGAAAADFHRGQRRRRLIKKAKAAVTLAAVLGAGFFWGTRSVATPLPSGARAMIAAVEIPVERTSERAEPEGLAPVGLPGSKTTPSTPAAGTRVEEAAEFPTSEASLAREPSN